MADEEQDLSQFLHDNWNPAHVKYSAILDSFEGVFRKALVLSPEMEARGVDEEVYVVWYVYFVPALMLANLLNSMEATLASRAGAPTLSERKLMTLLKGEWEDAGCECFMCQLCNSLSKNNEFEALRQELLKFVFVKPDGPLGFERLLVQ